MQLFAEAIGVGSPTLILLHGAGTNGAVFKPLLRELAWPGRVVVPDLRGHGRSPHGKHYGLAQHAADVADLLEPNACVHVLGHSMGGAVGLLLASGLFGVTVARASAFGVKVKWSAEELAKSEAFATSPVRWFDTRDAAAERFIRVAGLTGLVSERDHVVAAGIAEEGHRFRLAADPATVRAGGPAVAAIVAGARVPIRLFCGDRDPMVSVEDLRALDPHAFAIEGCGHSPHVEAPEQVAALTRTLHLG
jgi:pimeloyl-ACP methyl ester carboxylesterase